MGTVVMVYTPMGDLTNTMKKELSATLSDCRIVNIADSNLIEEVVEYGRVTGRVRERMMHYLQAAVRWDPRVIISACPSVGEVAETADKILNIPIIRINRAITKKASQHGGRIGAVAFPTIIIEPAASYIRHLVPDIGRNVRMIGRVAQGAYETNSRGRPEPHDGLTRKKVEVTTGEADVLTLTQGSMAGMKASLKKDTGLPVYAGSCLCIKEVQEICGVNR